ncbi:MAG: ROK family protein [Angelakisella sp.]
MNYYLGVDLGGTNIAVGLVDEQYNLLKKKSSPTPQNADSDTLAKAIKMTADLLLNEMNISLAQVVCLGVGTPGQVDTAKGEVVFACNLGLRNAPLGGALKKEFGIDSFLCNDADAAAFGESVAGAAKGSTSSVTVTLGTGVGCGVILNGKILPGEGGHITLVHNGHPCNCGRKGCFESYASATALIRQTREAMQNDKSSLMWQMVGVLEKVSGRTAFEAARKGDATAIKVVDGYIDYVSAGIISIINLIQPEVVCIGGGISGEGEILAGPVRKRVHAEQYPLMDQTFSRVEICRLGNDAGIIGAAVFGRYL